MIFHNDRVSEKRLKNSYIDAGDLYLNTLDTIMGFVSEFTNTKEEQCDMLTYYTQLLLESVISDYASMFISFDYISSDDNKKHSMNRPIRLFENFYYDEFGKTVSFTEKKAVSLKGKKVLTLPADPSDLCYHLNYFKLKKGSGNIPTSIYVPYINLISSYEDGNNRLQAAYYIGSDIYVDTLEYDITKQFADTYTDGRYWFHKNDDCKSYYSVDDFRFALIFTLSKIKFYIENEYDIQYLTYDGFISENDKLLFDRQRFYNEINDRFENTPYGYKNDKRRNFVLNAISRKRNKIEIFFGK